MVAGHLSVAAGESSAAIGYDTEALGNYSFATGNQTTAGGSSSFSSGYFTSAIGENSVAMGSRISVVGVNSFGIGLDNTQRNIIQGNTMAVMGGKVGLGTVSPNSSLHVATSTGNAEIDIQSGNRKHWGIYQVNGANDVDSVLRFWQTDDVLELKGDNGSIGGNQSQVIVKNELCLGGACKGSWPGGGLYVGKSNIAYRGNQGGYDVADSRCNAAFPGSHVCSNEEMFNSMRAGVSLPAGNYVWVNSGPGAISNDCGGWNISATTTKGTFWSLDGLNSVGYTIDCMESLYFACCK